MYRFFIDQENVNGDFIEIYEEDFHHAKNVLRLKLGDKLEIISPKIMYICEIISFSKDSLKTKILKFEKLSDIKIPITLYQALAKGDKFEYIVQKAVELGINKIVPFESERTIVKCKQKSYEKKEVRYKRIIKSASMQSKRNYIPTLSPPINLKDIPLTKNTLGLLAYEQSENSLKKLLRTTDSISNINIVIGPEGGFSENEIIYLKSKGYNSISLGERILRTETASLNLLSILGYELER